MRPKQKKQQDIRSAPMLILYALIACAIIVGTVIFALCYGGTGASILASASPADAAQPSAAGVVPIVPDATPQAYAQQPVATATPAPTTRTGRLIPYLENGLWGYKNIYGAVVIQPQYSAATEFYGDVAFAAQSGLYGLIDRTGTYIASPVWSNVLGFSEGRAGVEKNEKWGFIDAQGNLVIDYLYREVGDFACGRAMARSASAYAYIDMLGNIAISANWREANTFSEDMAFTTSDEYTADRHYIIDKVGEKIATLGSNTSGTAFSEGFAVIKSPEGYYYMNTSGSSAFGVAFAGAKPFSEGYAAVLDDETHTWGYINARGVQVIPYQFSDANPFSESYAAVLDKQTGLWGYINHAGSLVIAPQFDLAEPFSGKVAIVTVDGTHYILDTAGTLTLLY